jgi:hypothetical protein
MSVKQRVEKWLRKGTSREFNHLDEKGRPRRPAYPERIIGKAFELEIDN